MVHGACIKQRPLKPPGIHSGAILEIPLVSSESQSEAPTSDSKLSEARVVPPTSKGTTGLIPALGKGRSGIFDNDWSNFVDYAHTRHSKLTREQVEYILISMRQQALRICLPFIFPSNEETNQ